MLTYVLLNHLRYFKSLLVGQSDFNTTLNGAWSACELVPRPPDGQRVEVIRLTEANMRVRARKDQFRPHSDSENLFKRKR